MSTRTRSRQRRRKLLLELVQREEISSQNQLQSMLAHYDLEVNQATLSRDLRELGIIKVPLGSTGSRYVLPGAEASPRRQYEETFKRLVLSIKRSRNLLVLRTHPGHSQAACLALDNLHFNGVLGTVAGDDTFLVVLDEDANWDGVRHELLALAGLVPLKNS
jgi:transcriptional regulator of arginine metabolism